jgi:hypothetical protein
MVPRWGIADPYPTPKIHLFIVAIDSGQGIGTIHFEGFVEGGMEIFNKLFSGCPWEFTRDFQAPSDPPWSIR